MGDVIRELLPEEEGVYMPSYELVEPHASEATLATAQYVANLVSTGIKQQVGDVLVRLDSGVEVSSPYGIYIELNNKEE